jgi:hypothetical protein
VSPAVAIAVVVVPEAFLPLIAAAAYCCSRLLLRCGAQRHVKLLFAAAPLNGDLHR